MPDASVKIRINQIGVIDSSGTPAVDAAGGPRQVPLKIGLRFSVKALRPSR